MTAIGRLRNGDGTVASKRRNSKRRRAIRDSVCRKTEVGVGLVDRDAVEAGPGQERGDGEQHERRQGAAHEGEAEADGELAGLDLGVAPAGGATFSWYESDE